MHRWKPACRITSEICASVKPDQIRSLHDLALARRPVIAMPPRPGLHRSGHPPAAQTTPPRFCEFACSRCWRRRFERAALIASLRTQRNSHVRGSIGIRPPASIRTKTALHDILRIARRHRSIAQAYKAIRLPANTALEQLVKANLFHTRRRLLSHCVHPLHAALGVISKEMTERVG